MQGSYEQHCKLLLSKEPGLVAAWVERGWPLKQATGSARTSWCTIAARALPGHKRATA